MGLLGVGGENEHDLITCYKNFQRPDKTHVIRIVRLKWETSQIMVKKTKIREYPIGVAKNQLVSKIHIKPIPVAADSEYS